jgi:hypothetical protein
MTDIANTDGQLAPANDDQPGVKPLCPHCGSDRIVRDACARWDETQGRWTLDELYDWHFCETCNAEADFVAWPYVPLAGDDGRSTPDAT